MIRSVSARHQPTTLGLVQCGGHTAEPDPAGIWARVDEGENDVTDRESALIAARHATDQQMAHVDNTINEYLLPEAAKLLADNSSTTDAWALLGMNLLNQLRDRPDFLAEMLARLAIVFVSPEKP